MVESSHRQPPGPELMPARRFEWERIVRRLQISRSTKALAFILATYASADGSNVRPGRERLANVAARSPRTITRSLVELRDLGLIERTVEGSNYGRQAMSDEYRLTIPTDLQERVEMLDPDEGTGDTSVTRSARKQVSPMSPDPPGTGDTTRQEQVTKLTEQVTPVTGTGDSSVTPPEQDQPSTPEQDQPSSFSDATTEPDPWLIADHECNNGWKGWDDEGRPIPCAECKPHLAPVIPLPERRTG